jgi:glycosyltransferase involved in cell wall biosynthesis
LELSGEIDEVVGVEVEPVFAAGVGGAVGAVFEGAFDEGGFQAEAMGGDVEILPNLDADGKRALLASSTVFCVPTCKDETFGLYNVEAMAMGVPVIAPARGALPEVLGAVGGGVAVPDDDDALLDAIDALLRDDARRAAWSAAGPRGVAAGFTERHMAGAIERLLQGCGAGAQALAP